jgi:hypothetical protein
MPKKPKFKLLASPSTPGSAWRAILRRESPAAFALAFASEPILLASVTNATVHGTVAIRKFLTSSAAVYEEFAFTAEATVAQTTYLHWKGTALGHKTLEGLTVLARDSVGLIERIELYHRPLSIALAFARELERRLGDTSTARLFADPQ